jgi:MFS family permease
VWEGEGRETFPYPDSIKGGTQLARESKFYGWSLVGVLWILYLINVGFPYYGGGVINPFMAKSLNMSRSILGLGFTIITLIMGLSGPLIAFAINKKGIRFTMFWGSLTIVLGALLMASVVTNGWQFILIFGVVIGIGSSFGSAIPVQTGVTLWFKKKRALAMSIAITASGVGGFIAAPAVNKIITATNGNWKVAWLCVAGASGLAAIVDILFVRNKPSDLGQVPDGLRESNAPVISSGAKPNLSSVYRTTEDWKVGQAIKTPALWLLILSFVLISGPFISFIAHGVAHLKDLGHPPAVAALSLGFISLSSIAGRLLAGTLGDRIEPRYIWSVSLLLCLTGILVVIKATSLMQIYLYAILLGIGYGAVYLCWLTMTSNYFGANAFASIMGMQAPFVTLIGAITPFLVGLAYDYQGNYSTAFMVMAALTFLGVFLILFAKPPKPVRTVYQLKS